MNFMFSWQELYLTRSLRSLVRYSSCHSNIKFISSRHRVISSISHMKYIPSPGSTPIPPSPHPTLRDGLWQVSAFQLCIPINLVHDTWYIVFSSFFASYDAMNEYCGDRNVSRKLSTVDRIHRRRKWQLSPLSLSVSKWKITLINLKYTCARI